MITTSRRDIDERRNNQLRMLYNIIVEETGTRTTFLAQASGIANTMLNLWKNDGKNFRNVNLDRIEYVLQEKFPSIYQDFMNNQ